MGKVTPNTQGVLDRHQQILAAVSKEAQKLEARPDSEMELSNPAKQNHTDLPVRESTSGPDFFNSYWFAGLVIVVFVILVLVS